MYIIINGTTYEHARRLRSNMRISYIAEGLPEGLTAEGTVRSFRDDGFALCEDSVADYARQLSQAGALTLTNEPEPVETEPEEDDAPTWAEMATAIQEGVESV